MERKLAAIMFTDIAGYTAQMSKDQNAAFSLLEKKQNTLRPLVLKHNGTLTKEMGDGTLSHFPSAIDAAKCSIELQKATKDYANLNIRVGVHLGDTIFKDDDMFGDGVNIASRLENMSPPGGILVSKNVYDELSSVKGFEGISLGLQSLKGVGRLIEVFALKDQHLIVPNPDDYKKTEIEVHSDKEVPSVAVIPFDNKGDDEDVFYSYGISSDLITDLTDAGKIRVAGLKEIEKLEYNRLNYNELAKKLNVRYIAMGTLWKMNDIFQLSIELYDSKKSKLVWSDRWQEHWDNLTVIKANLSESLLSALDTNPITRKKIETTNSHAYEFYLKGKYCSDFLKTKQDLKNGKIFFSKALELDDLFVEAYYQYGLACQRLGNYDEAESTLLKGQEIAERKNNIQGLAYIYKGFNILYSAWGKWEKSRQNIEKALKIQSHLNNPTFEAMLLLDYASLLNHLNESDLSIEQNKKAGKLLKDLGDDRLFGISCAVLSNSYLTNRDYSRCIKYGKKSVDIFRKLDMISYLAKALSIMGDAFCRTGDYKNLRIIIDEAEPISKEFDDILIQAKISYFKAQYYLNKNDFNLAISNIDQSIELFNLAEHSRFETQVLIDKLNIIIECGNIDDVASIISKIEYLINKLKGTYSNYLFTAAKLYLNSKKGIVNIDELHSLYESLEETGDNFPLNFPLIYWYIAKAYYQINKRGKARECHEKAKQIIYCLAEQIKGKKNKKTFYKTYFHKRIHEDLS